MDVKLLMLAVKKLSDEVNELKASNETLQKEVNQLKQNQTTQAEVKKESPDEFLTTKQVLSMLGICYNTLQKVIQKGLIAPIRINQRRVVFSRKMLMQYLYSKAGKGESI